MTCILRHSFAKISRPLAFAVTQFFAFGMFPEEKYRKSPAEGARRAPNKWRKTEENGSDVSLTHNSSPFHCPTLTSPVLLCHPHLHSFSLFLSFTLSNFPSVRSPPESLEQSCKSRLPPCGLDTRTRLWESLLEGEKLGRKRFKKHSTVHLALKALTHDLATSTTSETRSLTRNEGDCLIFEPNLFRHLHSNRSRKTPYRMLARHPRHQAPLPWNLN